MVSATADSGDDFWYGPASQASASGVKVTPDVAIKASALFVCVKILAETIGTLPLRVYRDDPDGGRSPAPDDPIDHLIRVAPNDIQTSVEFWETQVLRAALVGTAYAEKILDGAGRLVALHPITDPVQAKMLPNRTLQLSYRDSNTGRRRVLFAEDVLRVPGLSSNGFAGMPVVELAAEAIGLGITQEVYASRVFSNGLNLGGYLVHPGALSPDAMKSLINQLMQFHSGAERAHRPAILQEGMKFERVGQTADEAQLLDARKWQIGEVARYFRMPLHMLGIYDGSTRSNVEQQSLDLVKYTLRPWVRRIEQAIKRDLIQEPDHSAKFNMEGLLRGDAASRAAFYHEGLLDGWVTRNEVRSLENLNRLDGLDVPMIPANMALVDEDGTAQAVGGSGADPASGGPGGALDGNAQATPSPPLALPESMAKIVVSAAERVVPHVGM